MEPSDYILPVPEEESPDELVFAFTYAVGTSYEPVLGHFSNALKQFGYSVVPIKISDFFARAGQYLGLDLKIKQEPYFDRVFSLMEAGNRLCDHTELPDFNARLGISEINRHRSQSKGPLEPVAKTAYLLTSLKRPEEADLMRDVYGPGFFLVGVYSPEQERLMSLMSKSGILEETKARELIEKDQKEASKFGQNSRDTFSLSDLFVTSNSAQCKQHIDRFVDLVFANPFVTPSLDEQNMFYAYSASLRSGDLSRQVGASLTSRDGTLLAVGCNDVPKSGGGLYWPGVEDQRDVIRGFDSNEKRRDEIIRTILPLLNGKVTLSPEDAKAVITKLRRDSVDPVIDSLLKDDDVCGRLSAVLCGHTELDLASAKERLRDTPLFSLTEFGRTVHAEMEAILACARSGRSTAGTILYATTFPCHNCTRHLIAAGVARVLYIEPYPKSLAVRLHYDAIELDEKGLERSANDCKSRVSFEPFLGVGPRRFFDLFSLKLSAGRKLERKFSRGNGEALPWARNGMQRPRVPMDPKSYLDREFSTVKSIIDLANGNILE